jgi:hypothetical protein
MVGPSNIIFSSLALSNTPDEYIDLVEHRNRSAVLIPNSPTNIRSKTKIHLVTSLEKSY